ncbi:DNA polymerase III subunit gamma/tau [Nitrococcus mobilis]|uniref:DNA polymerase III subunit gamma/tau n=1 Tax=Nitrococcus mobilis Nb-231 TaxID=314278 RepID=A4BTT1_9GAMM|nr:DNA polymerase III subunit gamma/tau [Nitrococcus mobilis]EAR20895.1 DNA polymerase III subunits gamma and tau [Nitrococcus mobilis Nb-231]
MNYQVLARKWRPRTFSEMAGQEHVLRALCNGLANGRCHHAYLFAGTRGVGKTTIARVLAKCLNCERSGITAEPCGECTACREIDQGRFVDLIEVDAASRTRVEDTRELLDNVQYAPARGRFKIYLVDEVHMLSQHSFNALLKTLEEPPPHVKFLLATTDPQKLPATVLSRCLQFNLKRLPAGRIADYLTEILAREGVGAEPAALRRLGHAADGSMRDALSLLDQAIAYGAGAVRDEDVREMLGGIESDFLFELLEALATQDGRALLEVAARMAERTPDFSAAIAELLLILHRLALVQSVADALPEDLPERDRLLDLGQRLTPEEVQLFYQIGLTGRRDLPLAPDPRTGFEMLLLRMLAFRPATMAPSPPAAQIPQPQSSSVREKPWTEASSGSSPGQGDEGGPRNTARAPNERNEELSIGPSQSPRSLDEWHAVVGSLARAGMVRALAGHCLWLGREGDLVRLRIDSSHAHLLNSNIEKRLCKLLSDRAGEQLRLHIEVGRVEGETVTERELGELRRRQKAAELAIENDPNIAAFREAFDARVVPDSIQPSED